MAYGVPLAPFIAYMNTEYVLSQKRQNLYLILCLFFVTNAIVAEVLGPKIFSLDKLVGHQLSTGWMQFNLSGGVIMWPVVFLTTDIINQFFGKKGVIKISLITFGLLVFVFTAFFVATLLPPADFWMEQNNKDYDGNFFNPNNAFKFFLLQGMNIIVGSLTAFITSQLVDALVYHTIRVVTKEKYIWLRATGSTIVSQFIDSFVILFIAFYFLGNWPLKTVLQVGVTQFLYKVLMAILLIPLIYIAHRWINKYLRV